MWAAFQCVRKNEVADAPMVAESLLGLAEAGECGKHAGQNWFGEVLLPAAHDEEPAITYRNLAL